MMTAALHLPPQPPAAAKRRWPPMQPAPPPSTIVSSSSNGVPSLQETFSALIDRSKSLTNVLQIHAAVLRHGLHQHHILNFKLQRAYSSLGDLDYSTAVFNFTPEPDVYNWTAIIHAQTQLGSHDRALLHFIDMLHYNDNGVQPNEFTFSAVLKSSPLEPGKSLHCLAFKFGLHLDLYVMTSLVDVYARVGDVGSAEKVFDKMPQRSLVSLTAMITCYTRHGHVDKARNLFDEMPERDAVSWNAMIDGYAQNGRPEEALLLFRQMMITLNPNQATVLSVLSACGQLGTLESGRWLHNFIVRNIEINLVVGTALIDMYSKCGSLEDANLVFEKMKVDMDMDVVTWNSMIAGYAMHGFTQDAFEMFDKMCADEVIPNDVTFIALLNGCGHTGLVERGWDFYNMMKNRYGIEPKVEHYSCMVTLLTRGGHVEEAFELVKRMKIEPDSVIWGTLLGSCRLHHNNNNLGEEIVEFLVKKIGSSGGAYTLLSNIYAASGNWDGVGRMRKLMKSSGVTKEKGCSSIVVDNTVHEFVAGHIEKHPKSREIYQMLEAMNNGLTGQKRVI